MRVAEFCSSSDHPNLLAPCPHLSHYTITIPMFMFPQGNRCNFLRRRLWHADKLATPQFKFQVHFCDALVSAAPR